MKLPGQVIKSGSFSCGSEATGATDNRLIVFVLVFCLAIAGEPWIELYLDWFNDPLSICFWYGQFHVYLYII